jgi:hypothetical protein
MAARINVLMDKVRTAPTDQGHSAACHLNELPAAENPMAAAALDR